MHHKKRIKQPLLTPKTVIPVIGVILIILVRSSRVYDKRSLLQVIISDPTEAILRLIFFLFVGVIIFAIISLFKEAKK